MVGGGHHMMVLDPRSSTQQMIRTTSANNMESIGCLIDPHCQVRDNGFNRGITELTEGLAENGTF